MTSGFDSFVIFAEMRTGSNYLEKNLNAIDGVTSYGEAFNPHFVGFPSETNLLGMTLDDREADPERLIQKIKSGPNLGGFRFFHDHDPRVLPMILDDRRCAKIILTRNPVETFVSWKIAQKTDQWRLKNLARRRDARVHFDPLEFSEYLKRLQDFQSHLRYRLKRSGQSAFFLDYEELRALEVVNGLAAFLGVAGRLDRLDDTMKVQNPASLSEKVVNHSTLEDYLNRVISLDTKTPAVHELRRSTYVKSYVAGAKVPLLYLPVPGTPDSPVLDWMAGLDSVSRQDLVIGFSQKELRQWKRCRPGHRSFSVVCHPLERAHHVFCQHILNSETDGFDGVRKQIIRLSDGTVPDWSKARFQNTDALRAGFRSFLVFVHASLTQPTSLVSNALWASQAQVIADFAQFATPDIVFRNNELSNELPALAQRFGYDVFPYSAGEQGAPFNLSDIYDDDIEDLARKAYQRDYTAFGFDRWR